MLTDAHCHPYDLTRVFPESETERSSLGVLAAASACNIEEFKYNEALPNMLPCFGIHPQLLSLKSSRSVPWNAKTQTQRIIEESLELQNKLAGEERIHAIGECGFDLYNETFKETEALQEDIFTAHLEIALQYDLPLVLHVRRAMHKIFGVTEKLKKCKAVVFHSWPGTYEEARSLLRHNINVYFSFGNIIMLNHKKAIQSCALLPVDRLLTETDAPYAPRRGESFSRWKDLPLILETAAIIRSDAGNKTDAKDLEAQIEINFRKVFY